MLTLFGNLNKVCTLCMHMVINALGHWNPQLSVCIPTMLGLDLACTDNMVGIRTHLLQIKKPTLHHLDRRTYIDFMFIVANEEVP